MVANLVKKELYKQKPKAKLIGRGKTTEAVVKGFQEKVNDWEEKFEEDGNFYYEAELVIGKDTSAVVVFEIPSEEMNDKEGNRLLKDEEPAQLLIRWLL